MKNTLIIGLLLLAWGCGEGSGSTDEGVAPNAQQELLDQIHGLEALIVDAEHATVTADIQQTPTQRDAEQLLQHYKTYIAQYPEDDHAQLGNMALYAARIAEQLGTINPDPGRARALYSEAIKYYQLTADEYGDVIEGRIPLFAIAVLLDFEMMETDRAKPYYEQVATGYPGTDEARDSEARLQTIDLSPLELIEKFNADLQQAG